jgi:putative heme d1 biosynthesis radical SAM protein NirJ2
VVAGRVIVSWNVTNRCNLKCEHCYRDAGTESERELDTEEGKALLDEIAKAGAKMIVFSGGEPFMREDILELTRHAASLGLRPVYGTNGTFLTKEMALKVMEAGGASVAISLHMTDPKELDEFMGMPGTYDAAIEAMRVCKEVGLRFQVNTTVFKRNADQILEVCELAHELGAMSHHVLFLVPTGRGVDMEEETLREKEYETLIRDILLKREELGFDIKPTCAPQFMRIAEQRNIDMGRYTRGCLAGINYCSIIPNGDVWPCPYLPMKLGNVRETPFSEIWAANPVFENMRSMEYSGGCGPCKYKEKCGGCRARAHFYFGDYMAHEPWCAYGRGIAP